MVQPLIELQPDANAGPIIGKTYTLYGGSTTSNEFFTRLSDTTNEIIRLLKMDEKALLDFVCFLSRSRRRILKKTKSVNIVPDMLNILKHDLSIYFTNIESHLSSITFSQKWDRRLATSFEQYLLYLVEIELTNRIFQREFLKSSIKLAMLPHCLRDFTRKCIAASDETDYLCKGCSKICSINHLSKLLKSYEILPYIWMKADLKKMFRSYRRQHTGIGVLGIACIPELTFGMRFCRKHAVPVIGIPLDANRCRRWMGDFYANSINMNVLGNLLSTD